MPIARGRDDLVRRGIALEIFTLAWMTVEAGVSVAAGVAARSVALLAFGIDSVIELVGALVVLQTFRAEHAGRAGRSEARALRMIGVTFFLLAAYIVADSANTLIAASKPESSVPGVAVTAAALVVMQMLSVLKRRTRSRLGSQMLLADAAESLFSAYFVRDRSRRPLAQRRLWPVVGRSRGGSRSRAPGHQGGS